MNSGTNNQLPQYQSASKLYLLFKTILLKIVVNISLFLSLSKGLLPTFYMNEIVRYFWCLMRNLHGVQSACCQSNVP